MGKILLIASPGLLVYLTLAWLLPNLLGVQGVNRWILRAALALIGILATSAIVWFLSKRKKQQSEAGDAAAEEAVDAVDIDLLIREAAGKLAQAGLGKIGTLPVVLLLGEPGSAKTSTIVNAGLDAELLAGKVFQDNAVAPTSIANLWFARRAILADVGGRVLGDAAQWSHLVRRLRPAKLGAVVGKKGQAPRAVLVCCDAEALVRGGGAEAAAASARSLRRRVGEIAQALGVHLPTYVLFTRMDRVPFFAEYVRNLSNDEAMQVFGATLPLMPQDAGAYAQNASARVAGAFDDLYRSLCDFRPEFLAREHDAAQLPGIYEFPREFRKLRGLIVDFLTELCRPSQLAMGPFLRGFYFSGVRPVVVQEVSAAPVYRAPEVESRSAAPDATGVFRAGARGLQQPGPAAAAQQVLGTRRVPQWVFVNRFLQQVVLEDRMAMGTSASSTKANFMRRVLLAAAVLACVVCSIGFIVSYGRNRALESRVKQAAAGISAMEGAGAAVPSADALKRLETLRESLEVLTRHNREGAPWSYRWGLYTGDDLYPDTRRLYFDRFRQLLFAYTQAGLLDDLRRLPPKPGPEYGPTYDTLKTYLITTSHPDKSTRAFLSPALLGRWKQGRNITPGQTELAQKQFEFYSDELAFGNPFSRENDAAAIRQARVYLAQFGGFRRIYQAMLADAAKAAPPVNFNKKFAGSAAYVVDNYEVPGAFTKEGWEFMKEVLRDPRRYFSGEQWVLGDQVAGAVDPAELEKQVRQWYGADLLTHWRAYFKSASVVKYADLKDAAGKLNVLSAGNQSPLLALFWLAAQNTALEEPEASAPFQPVHAVVPPASVDSYVAPTNQNYVNALATLQTSVETAVTQQPNDDAVTQVQINANAAWDAKRQITNTFRINADQSIGASVQKLLEDPITNIRTLVTDLVPAELNGKGKTLCAQFRPLWNKYPFNAGATAQATVAEINAMFRKPDGALWMLYDENLQKLLPLQGGRYVPAPNPAVKLNPAFVRFFQEAAALSETLYAGGTQNPHFSFTLKPVPTEGIQNIGLRLDGQALSYTGGTAAPKPFTWQAAGVHEAKATVRFGSSTDLAWSNNEGLWAIFQFFGKAERWQSVGNAHQLEWIIRIGKDPMTLPNGSPLTVRFELDMAGAPPVFQKGYFARMGCVAEIAR